MNLWMRDLAQNQPTAQEAFTSSIAGVTRLELEKNAGEFSEYLDGLLEQSATPNLDRLQQQTKLAQQMGRELAHLEAMEKQAGIPSMGSIMGALKPMAGKALGWAAKNPTAAMGVGGAALGAATAAPGHRMTGALTGGAIGAGAGHLGQAGMTNLANRGLSKLAFAPMARAGIGALAGGAMGALHKSQAEKQGLESGHHLRNALMGAAGGAALGAGSKQIGKTLVGAEHAVAPAAAHAAAPAAQVAHAPAAAWALHGSPKPGGLGGWDRPVKGIPMEQQIANYRAKGNMSPSDSLIARHMPSPSPAPSASSANQTMAGAKKARPNPALANTMGGATAADRHAGVRAQLAHMNRPPTQAGMPKMAGANFLKLAWATKVAGPPPIPGGALAGAASKVLRRPPPIPAAAGNSLGAALKTLTPHGHSVLQQVPKFASIQAEPGTPGGAQEPEAEPQVLSRPISKPAAELYGALKHLSPKTMQGLQTAQPGA